MNQFEVGGKLFGNDDDVPDVMASINVNNEIVRGTASLQQSRDSSNFIGATAEEDHVKVQCVDILPSRALSQAHDHQVRDRILDFVESDKAVVGYDPKSFQGNHIIGEGDRAVESSPAITETVHANPVNAVFRDSFEDDWQNRFTGAGGYTETEKGPQEQHLIPSRLQNSHQTTEMTGHLKILETTLPIETQPDEFNNHLSETNRLGHLKEAQKDNRENEEAQDNGSSEEQYSEQYEDQEREDNEEWVQEEQQRIESVKELEQSTQDQRKNRDSNFVVQEDLERLVINLNHTAMANLKNDNFKLAKHLLLKAEHNLLKVDTHVAELQATTDSIQDFGDTQFTKKVGIGHLDALKNRLMGLTYNNLGCLCKQQQDFHGALAYLKAALDYESRLEEYEEEERNIDELMEMDAKDLEFQMDLRTLKCNSAGTILNICAILSKLNKHKQAHEYACEAVVKLRHSMKLTKSQVVQEQNRIGLVHEKLNREGSDSKVQTTEIQKLKLDLEAAGKNRMHLESQWVNLATTAVIAHYNAAVELEFMSLWREALTEYEKAAQLSAIAMKPNNPMTVKIKQAIGKMRIKVRNNVQLPDKLVLEGATNKRKPGKSQIASSKYNTSSQPMKDWQNSVNSVRSSQFHAYQQKITTVSDEFMVETSPQKDPQHNSVIEQRVYSLEAPIRQQLPTPATGIGPRDSKDGSLGIKQVGLRSVIKTRANEQNPISLRKIIDKLEHTEKLEQVQTSKPKDLRFGGPAQKNNVATKVSIASNKSSRNEEGSTLSVLWERQNGLPPRNTTLSFIRGGKASRNEVKRSTLNSAGFNTHQTVDVSFLPSLIPQIIGKQGLQTTRNSRISTVQGLRTVTSPLNNNTDGTIKTGQAFGQRTSSKPPPVINNAWGVIPPPKSPHNYNEGVSFIKSQEHGPAEQSKIITVDGSSNKKQSLNITPSRLVNILSMTHERRLIDESKKLGDDISKREKDINFFLAHIKPKSVRSKNSQRPTVLNTISTDLASVRQQVLLDSSASHLAGSAYLPERLKKTLKQRKFASQIKKMQKKIIKEHEQDLNAQLETAFQREIALWRHERDNQIDSKLKEIEDVKAQQEFVYTQIQQKLAAEYADVATPTLTSKESKTEMENVQMQSDLAEILCAEQAQEAISIYQETGPSVNNYEEEEVGNLRDSPLSLAGHKKTDIQSKIIPEESLTLVGHGQIQIMEEFSEDIREEKPDTAAAVNLQSEVQVKGAASSDVSEYESSINMMNENQLGVAPSGTGHEVDLGRLQKLKSVSETLEVLDIVSADTNNALLNNFDSQRTSEHIFNNTHGEITSQVTTQQMLYKTRINADSALNQYVSEISAGNNEVTEEGNRGNNAQSSLQMMSKFDPMEEQKLENESESIAAGSPARYPEANERNAPQEFREITFDQQRRNHLTGDESSIVDSHISGTQLTQIEEPHYAKMDLHGITLHEEMLEGWKIQVDVDSPDLTDDNMTVTARKSPIGEGSIYIKKSAEYASKSRATQKLNKKKTNALEPRSDSMMVSDLTVNTRDARYKSGSRIGEYKNQVGILKTQERIQQKRDSLAQRSLAQTSELVIAKFGSGISMEAPSIDDDASQITDKLAARPKQHEFFIHSGQTNVLPHKKEQIQTQKNSFVTPRPVQIKPEISWDTKKTLERSSIDTEQVSKAMQGNIKHAKPQASKRSPAIAATGKTQTTKRYVTVMAQKPLRANSVVKPLELRNKQSTTVRQSSQIPAMIHIQDSSVISPIASPTNVVKRLKTTANKTSGQQINFAISALNNRNQTLKSKDLKEIMDDSHEQQPNQKAEYADAKVIQTEDRVAKIAQQISKLNTTLLQFQTEAEELKKDPMLKSTHRSNASRTGLASQKSRDTNMTMPVTFPDQVRALQEKRLMAQLQSAPGRSRANPGNFHGNMLIETKNKRAGESPIAPRMRQTQKTLLMNQDQNYDISPQSVNSTIKSVLTMKTNQ